VGILHNDPKKKMSSNMAFHKNSLKILVLFRKQYLVTKLTQSKTIKLIKSKTF